MKFGEYTNLLNESSHGIDAWEKYFAGLEIETTVNKNIQLLDINTLNKSIKMKKGDNITVIPSSEYNTKIDVIVNKKMYKIPFSALAKPIKNKSITFKIKPQDFKSISAKYSSAENIAKKLVIDINKRVDILAPYKAYMVDLVKYYTKSSGNIIAPEITNFAQINKDFGEIIGALACIRLDLLESIGIKLNNPKISFPLAGNEPIVDYYIKDGNKVYSISAKSGNTTNTLKLADIQKLGNNIPKELNEIITIIAENSVIMGPVRALNKINPSIFNEDFVDFYSNIKSKNLKDPIQGFETIRSTLTNTINTVGQLWYYSESYLVKYINNIYEEDLKEVFLNSIQNIIYIKFQASKKNLAGSVEVLNSKSFNNKKIKIRSKNTTKYAKDKLGVQT